MTPRERSEAREAAGYAAGRVDRRHPIYQHLVNASLDVSADNFVNGPVLDAINHIIQWERRPPLVDG